MELELIIYTLLFICILPGIVIIIVVSISNQQRKYRTYKRHFIIISKIQNYLHCEYKSSYNTMKELETHYDKQKYIIKSDTLRKVMQDIGSIINENG